MSDLTNSLSRSHQCGQCGKSFTSSHQLAQHSRVHSGEKPYKCSYCDRKFKQLSHVQQHTRLHTGERPYKCSASECGRSFIQLSNLQQHLKTHAIPGKETRKKFFCNQCGKDFKSQSSLYAHQCKKHPETFNRNEHNPYISPKHQCKICGKVYSNEGSFKKHIESHQSAPAFPSTPAAPQLWPCNVCRSVFSTEFALVSHIEKMKDDPKHRFEAQFILTCAAAEKKNCVDNINLLTNALVTNGDSNSEQNEANISAQTLLQMSLIEDSSSIASQSHNRTNGNEANDLSDFDIHSGKKSCNFFH